MKRFLFLILVGGLAMGQAPAGYYDGTAGLTGYALKTKLHTIISTGEISYDYDNLGNNGLYQQTDKDLFYENDGTLLDLYSERPTGPDAYSYTFNNVTGSAGSEGLGWNREHIIPSSMFLPAFADELYPMYSDLFSVIPVDAYVNQQRSNYPHANSSGSSKTFTNGGKLGTSSTTGYTNFVYEPIDEFKGDIARIYLYFAVRYQSFMADFDSTNARSTFDGSAEKAFKNWYINMLLLWHQNDPPSAREIDRNNKVFDHQKNRNPFIDHPEWANMIWNQAGDGVAPSAPSSLNVSQTGESFVTVTWSPSASTDVTGYKLYKDGLYAGQTYGNSFTFDRLNANTSYNFEVRAFDTSYLQSASAAVNASTTSADTLAKDLMITKYVEGTANNKAIEITNKTGHYINLANYQLRVQFAERSYDKEIYYRLEGDIAPGESVVIVHPSAAFSGYDNSTAEFQAVSVAEFTGIQYIELTFNGTSGVDAVGFPGGNNTLSDRSLYRNANVTDPTTAFNLNEWTPYAVNYIDGLGSGTLANDDIKPLQAQITIYPNPVQSELFISGDAHKIVNVQIYDLAGKLILSAENPFKAKNSLNVQNLKPGLYLIKLDDKVMKFIKN